jgi:hypothetical protein
MAFTPDTRNHSAPDEVKAFFPEGLPKPEIISKQGWNAIGLAVALTGIVLAGGTYLYYFGK